MYLARIFKISWLGVVIELISSYWKVTATCADSWVTDIFFSYKCVINELTRTRHNCQSSRTHQKHTQTGSKQDASPPNLYITVKNTGI